MTKREKQRIFKRFMEGSGIVDVTLSVFLKERYTKEYAECRREVEQAIRECVNEIKKGEK